MKYELSQAQYRDFLNTLTRAQQTNRVLEIGTVNDYAMSDLATVTYRGVIRLPSSLKGGSYPEEFGCDYAANGSAGDEVFDQSDDGEWIAAGKLTWMDVMAYGDWAGLRPMTELEFEKAARGPLAQVYGEYAWGTTTITDAVASGESLDYSGLDIEMAPNTGHGLCNYDSDSSDEPSGPMRVGFAATSTTDRTGAGAGYYGVMDLSGNVYEYTVTVGVSAGRSFEGSHGDGILTTTASYEGNATNTDWPGISATTSQGVTGGTGNGIRGGAWDGDTVFQISDRFFAAAGTVARSSSYGGRLARTDATWWKFWSYRMEITIDSTYVDSDLTDFPLLLEITDSELTFAHTKTDGSDLRFTDADGNLLKYEVAEWDTSGSTGEVWVGVPEIDSSDGATIYMYYGNTSASAGQDPAGLWGDAGAVAVWHMSEGTGDSVGDSLGDNDGTRTNASWTASGQTGNAMDFDGTGDVISISDSTSLDFSSGDFSICAWTYPEDEAPAGNEYMIGQYDYGANKRSIALQRMSTSGNFAFLIDDDGTSGVECVFDDIVALPYNTWQHIAATFSDSGNTMYAYRNGSSITSDTCSTNPYSTDAYWGIGSAFDTYPTTGAEFDGVLDDVMIFNRALDADEIKFMYYNQNESGNEVSFGSEETNFP